MSSAALKAVYKSFDAGRGSRTDVLFDVSFEAEQGEFLVLLGPSGCGKSTSLRLIAGLEHANEGDVLIGGERVNDVPAAERELAMVFQNYALFPHLSVKENILFGLKVRRVPKDERGSRLEETAHLLELTDYLDRKPAQLSGGQRQRVALGRALVSGASLILMDEPLSNLDAKLRQQMRVELRELQQRLGLTVIYVTHDQVEAMTMADRVVVMRSGRVDQVADPKTLYQQPARAEVARFIGAPPMNLLPATVADGQAAIDGTQLSLGLDLPPETNSQVHVGVRPEDIQISPGEFTVPATVTAVELLGADQLVRFDIGSSQQLIARVPGSAEVDAGTSLDVSFDRRHVHVFDAGDGVRVPTEPHTAGRSPA